MTKRSATPLKQFFMGAGLMLGASAATASGTVRFQSIDVDCGRLQGANREYTCSFVQNVERAFRGATLVCPSEFADASPSAQQAAGDHLSRMHGKHIYYRYTEGRIAKANARQNGTSIIDELKRTHPRDYRDIFNTYLIVHSYRDMTEQRGISPQQAYATIAQIANQNNVDIPGGARAGSITANDISAFIDTSDIIRVRKQCLAVTP